MALDAHPGPRDATTASGQDREDLQQQFKAALDSFLRLRAERAFRNLPVVDLVSGNRETRFDG